MKNILMMTEAYGGGIKTHFDLINKYSYKLENFKLVFYISEKRLNNVEKNGLHKCIVNNELSNFGKISNFIKNLKSIDEIVSKNNIDIIHAHSTIAGLIAKAYSILYKKRKVQIVYTPHGYFSQGEYTYLKKRIISIIEKIIEKNNYTIHVSIGENSHSKKFNISEKATIISNGVEVPAEFEKKIKNETITFGYLGRAEYPKNVERFIELAYEFECKSGIKANFIFGGYGKDIKKIEEMIKKMKVKNVKLPGIVDKKDFFNEIDIYMSTSKYEGLPFSVIEAMSYKKPLILSRINGHLDFKKSSATLLYDLESDNNEIVGKISEFVDDNDFDKFKDQIFIDFMNHFSIEDMMRKMNILYNNID